jgi:hypothetical protein
MTANHPSSSTWPAADAWPAPPAWPAPTPRPSRTGRVVALVVGALLLLPGIGLLGGGGVALWADWFHRSNGFVVSPQEGFTSEGYALVSDRIELSATPEWLPAPDTLGTARLEVTGMGPREVFVGVAPATDARAYLDGVQRTVVDGLGFDAPATGSDQLPGGEPPGPPAQHDFWIAEAAGGGTQEVTWDPADGDWMFVVMNADGSPLVDVEARIGAEFPSLGGIGWGLLGVGGIVTLVAVLLLARAGRRPYDVAVYRQPSEEWSPRRSGSVLAGPAPSWAVDAGSGHPQNSEPD